MNKQDLETLQVRFRDTDFRCRLDGDVVIVDKPVRKDEYGVPLFKGYKYWWARDIDFYTHKAFTIYTNKDCIIKDGIEILVENDDCKIFASKESAERWIKENKPRKPLYVDPDNGDEFFDGDEVFYYSFIDDTFNVRKDCIENIKDEMEATRNTSKSYNTREKCEIALAEFIANKHGKILIDIHNTDGRYANFCREIDREMLK